MISEGYNQYVEELEKQKKSLMKKFLKNMIFLSILDVLFSIWAVFFLNFGFDRIEFIKNLSYSEVMKIVIAFLPLFIVFNVTFFVIYRHILRLNKLNNKVSED